MMISTEKFLDLVKNNYYGNAVVNISKLLDKFHEGLQERAEQIASGEEIMVIGFGLGNANIALVSTSPEKVREMHDVAFTCAEDLIKAIAH